MPGSDARTSTWVRRGGKTVENFTDGLALVVTAPMSDQSERTIGAVYGGVLMNHYYDRRALVRHSDGANQRYHQSHDVDVGVMGIRAMIIALALAGSPCSQGARRRDHRLRSLGQSRCANQSNGRAKRRTHKRNICKFAITETRRTQGAQRCRYYREDDSKTSQRKRNVESLFEHRRGLGEPGYNRARLRRRSTRRCC